MVIKQYKKQKNIKKNNKSKLGEITTGNPDHKSDSQSNVIKNAQNLYNSRQKLLIYLKICKN